MTMKSSRRRGGVWPVVFLCGVGLVRGAEGGTNALPASTDPVPLEEVVAGALKDNPELRFYEAEIAAARGERRSQGAMPNPELSANLGQKTVRGGGLRGEGVAWSVSLVQPFEWPGRIGLRKAIANQDVELAELGLARFRVALAGRIRVLGYGLSAAEEMARAAAEVAERLRALRDVLVQRDPAGLTPLLETRVIEAIEVSAQRKGSEASLAVESALLELNQARGAAPETPLRIEPLQLQFVPAEGWEVLVQRARTNNFELRIRAVELAQQGFRTDLARRERYPLLSVGPYYSEETAGDERERIIGLGVSLPLPLWNRNGGSIAAAAAREVQAETALYVAQRDVETRLARALRTYETKRKEISAWRPDSILHFKEAAEVADRHYRLGAVPVSTYVELQNQYLAAVEGLLDTRREALEAAAQIEELTGFTSRLVTTEGP